jgi:hypothetical protein
MASKPANSTQIEDRISIVVKAYKNAHFKGVRAAVIVYNNILYSTLAHRING